MQLNKVVKVLALTAGLGLVGGQAQAVTWGTIVSSVGSAYGNFYNQAYVTARNTDSHKKNNSGDDGIYVHTNYDFGGHGVTYYWTNSRRTTSHAYVGSYSEHNLLRGDSFVRATINVCEDRSFQPDPCSDHSAIPSFSY
jgi:hypothetical protein